MPLNGTDLYGTEKDGSKSSDYCIYCYKDGSFTNPDLTLEQMMHRVTNKMDAADIPEDILEAAISRLPHLKRWAIADKAQEK